MKNFNLFLFAVIFFGVSKFIAVNSSSIVGAQRLPAESGSAQGQPAESGRG